MLLMVILLSYIYVNPNVNVWEYIDLNHCESLRITFLRFSHQIFVQSSLSNVFFLVKNPKEKLAIFDYFF